MAGRIPRAFIDELLARTDIVEVIGSRVPLKKAGKAVGTSKRTVSADGKTLTAVSKMTDAKGATSESTMVFDKQ